MSTVWHSNVNANLACGIKALWPFLLRKLEIGKFKLQISSSLGSFVSDRNICTFTLWRVHVSAYGQLLPDESTLFIAKTSFVSAIGTFDHSHITYMWYLSDLVLLQHMSQMPRWDRERDVHLGDPVHQVPCWLLSPRKPDRWPRYLPPGSNENGDGVRLGGGGRWDGGG